MAELDLKDESDKSVLARLVRRTAWLLSGNGCSLARGQSWCVLKKFPLKKCISKVAFFCLKVRKCGKESLVPVIMAMDSLAAGSDTTGFGIWNGLWNTEWSLSLSFSLPLSFSLSLSCQSDYGSGLTFQEILAPSCCTT